MRMSVSNSLVLPSHKQGTVRGPLAALSHSIRQRLGAHTGAECVLRATYQGRGNRREAGEGEKGQIG